MNISYLKNYKLENSTREYLHNLHHGGTATCLYKDIGFPRDISQIICEYIFKDPTVKWKKINAMLNNDLLEILIICDIEKSMDMNLHFIRRLNNPQAPYLDIFRSPIGGIIPPKVTVIDHGVFESVYMNKTYTKFTLRALQKKYGFNKGMDLTDLCS